MELLINARMGWEKFNYEGKLLALFIAVLLFIWFYKGDNKHKGLWLYATVMMVCCSCPLTAALLMVYQTKFYDYQWTWSAVPVIGLTAYGIVLFVSELWKTAKRTRTTVLLALAVILLLSGGLNRTMDRVKTQNEGQAKQQQAYLVLEKLQEMVRGGNDGQDMESTGNNTGSDARLDIVLWAPVNILEYAREFDGAMKLLYGRNMWNEALNAYSYDVYNDDMKKMYEQMELWAEPDRTTDAALTRESFKNYVSIALQAGANTIILPDTIPAEALQEAEALFQTALQVEDYWILYGRVS